MPGLVSENMLGEVKHDLLFLKSKFGFFKMTWKPINYASTYK